MSIIDHTYVTTIYDKLVKCQQDFGNQISMIRLLVS